MTLETTASSPLAPSSLALLEQALAEKGLRRSPTLRVFLALEADLVHQGARQSAWTQETVERLLPWGVKFDELGALRAWVFAQKAQKLELINSRNCKGFIQEEVRGSKSLSKALRDAKAPGCPLLGLVQAISAEHGSRPAPASSSLWSIAFGGESEVLKQAQACVASAPAGLAFIVINGGSADFERAALLLKQATSLPLYWQILVIGNMHKAEPLRRLAKELPHVGLIYIPQAQLHEEGALELYRQMLTPELCGFLARPLQSSGFLPPLASLQSSTSAHVLARSQMRDLAQAHARLNADKTLQRAFSAAAPSPGMLAKLTRKWLSRPFAEHIAAVQSLREKLAELQAQCPDLIEQTTNSVAELATTCNSPNERLQAQLALGQAQALQATIALQKAQCDRLLSVKAASQGALA